jgi:hypothetical protein
VKAYTLRPEELAWILTPSRGHRPGTSLEIQVTRQVPGRQNLWSLASFADRLQSLPNQNRPRALNILLTHKGTRLQAWAATERDCRAFTNQWQSFNPALRAYPPKQPWLTLRPGATVRAFHLRMRSACFLPINYEFGRVGSHQIDSPVTHLHNSLPQPPPGSAVFLQITWQSSTPYWHLLPWTRLRASPRGIDQKAAEFKAKQTRSYYVAVRGFEVHARPSTENLGREIAESFGVFGREGANGFTQRPFRFWRRARTMRLVKAILENDPHMDTLRGPRRPRFMPLEAAALLHPPPPGQEPPSFPHASVDWQEAPLDRRRPETRRSP